MSGSTLGGYRPGSTVLHRLRPGAKLLGLLLFGIAVIAVPGWPAAAAAVAVGLGLALTAGMRSRDVLRAVAGFIPVAVLLFAFQMWQHGWERGVEVVGGLLALILAASAVTRSTASDDLLDTIVWAIGPLRRVGISPERVALAFALAFRAIPLAIDVARETRGAARARGLERNPRAYVTPFVLRMVAHARHTGEALHARGLGDEEQPLMRST